MSISHSLSFYILLTLLSIGLIAAGVGILAIIIEIAAKCKQLNTKG